MTKKKSSSFIYPSSENLENMKAVIDGDTDLEYTDFLLGMYSIAVYPRLSPSFFNIPQLRPILLEKANLVHSISRWTTHMDEAYRESLVENTEDQDEDILNSSVFFYETNLADVITPLVKDSKLRRTYGIPWIIREYFNIWYIMFSVYYGKDNQLKSNLLWFMIRELGIPTTSFKSRPLKADEDTVQQLAETLISYMEAEYIDYVEKVILKMSI